MSTIDTNYDVPALSGEAIALGRTRGLFGEVMGFVAIWSAVGTSRTRATYCADPINIMPTGTGR